MIACHILVVLAGQICTMMQYIRRRLCALEPPPTGSPAALLCMKPSCGWIIWTIVFDFLRISALRTMEQRYDVAGCLLQGKVYSEIRQLTGASSATVSRVNRMLNYGTGAVGKSVRYDLAAQQDGENSEGGTTE